MRFDDLCDKRRRLERHVVKLGTKTGDGEKVSYTPKIPKVPDSWPNWAKEAREGAILRHYGVPPRVVNIRITGMKSAREYGDEASITILLLASLKDPAKEALKEQRADPRPVEEGINRSWALSLCIDLCNTDKHAVLSRGTRSGKQPQYGRPTSSIPSHAMDKIVYSRSGHEIDVGRPSEVTYLLPILDENGVEIGEAGQLIAEGLEDWNLLMSELGLDPVE